MSDLGKKVVFVYAKNSMIFKMLLFGQLVWLLVHRGEEPAGSSGWPGHGPPVDKISAREAEKYILLNTTKILIIFAIWKIIQFKF
jgi:hypothetical protein